jgi:hypothetical protein
MENVSTLHILLRRYDFIVAMRNAIKNRINKTCANTILPLQRHGRVS